MEAVETGYRNRLGQIRYKYSPSSDKNFEEYLAETLFVDNLADLGSRQIAAAHATYMRERTKQYLVQTAKAAVTRTLPKRPTGPTKPKVEEEKPGKTKG